MEYAELGMEAIWRIEVVDFPAFVVIDDKGNDFFKELNLGANCAIFPNVRRCLVTPALCGHGQGFTVARQGTWMSVDA